jgi:hypothetical protein
MPSNATLSFSIPGNLFCIKNIYNFNLYRFFQGGYFAASGGGQG